jgi:hypothetical protein
MDEIEELNRKVNAGNNGCLFHFHFGYYSQLNFILLVAGKPNSPRKCGTV